MGLSGLIPLLIAPNSAPGISDDAWNQIIRESRQSQTLGQLAAALRSANTIDLVPPAVQRHLHLAHITSQARSAAATAEISTIRRELTPQIPIMLLKGCAYVAAGDLNGNGRLFSDIDLLVARDHLGRTETSLLAAGWMGKRVNTYDQRYYREWTHEIPPLEHVRRHTVVDLHHAIVPPVSRYSFDVQEIWDNAEEIFPGIYIPSAIDRVIHCAIHLIQEGEASKVFRDLYDLHLLVCQHCPDPEKTSRMFQRADHLGLGDLVRPAVSAAQQIFFSAKTPGLSTTNWLTTTLAIAAISHHDTSVSPISKKIAGWLLLAHSHWMKLPLHLLAAHLWHKAFAGTFVKEKAGETA